MLGQSILEFGGKPCVKCFFEFDTLKNINIVIQFKLLFFSIGLPGRSFERPYSSSLHGFVNKFTSPMQASFFASLKTKPGGGAGSRTPVRN